MATKSYAETISDIQKLKGHAAELRAELAAIAADGRYSDEYRQRLMADKRAEYISMGEGVAQATVIRAKRRIEQAKTALAEAHRATDAGIDSALYNRKLDQYRTTLRNSPPQERPQVLARLVEQAQHTPEGKSALQLAASDYSDLKGQTEARPLRQWADEAVAPIKAAELEAADAEEGFNRLYVTVLEVESDLTGRRGGFFSGPTPWQRSVLGEDLRSLGMVVDRSVDDVGGGPPDTHMGIPVGVKVSPK